MLFCSRSVAGERVAAKRLWRCRSATTMAMIWRRRASRAPRCSLAASGSGRNPGRVAAAKWAITAASIGSVLARRPSARAKSRTCAGLTTTTGSPAAPSVADTTLS